MIVSATADVGQRTLAKLRVRCPMWRLPKIRDPFLGGPHNKDYSIWVSILGFLNFGKLPCLLRVQKALAPDNLREHEHDAVKTRLAAFHLV